MLLTLIASPAAADEEVVGTWRSGEWWFYVAQPYDPSVVQPGKTVDVNFGESFFHPNRSFHAIAPALPVGQVTRIDGLNLSELHDGYDILWRNYLYRLGYDDGGFHPINPVTAVTYADIRRATAFEMEFLRWDHVVEDNGDGDLYHRMYVHYEVRLLAPTPTPEPGAAVLLGCGLCGVVFHRRRG